ncbi:hypothetical protein FP76_gp234 [Bacillus phage Evoli]|uniref:DUF7448 domain-containing protein n=3 Tax=Bastillevirus TaxID=1918010 RepID=A0A024B094_9CAUD|nr:hypothetical protein FP76_gp234 [Bacillus phage Evoli]AHZ09860.1 hypothetical protein [Bacillus phage Evoli]AMW61889.1 hypothetical protein DNAM5_145 [Bacillus phage Vinny]ASU00986.1 hypothetical protein ANTHONY_146 [Bacillus phage Anthony]
MYWRSEDASIEELVGKTIVKIVNDGELTFETSDREVYVMYHQQDCCESVYLEDINGDLDDLLWSPVLFAEEMSNEESEDIINKREKEEPSRFNSRWGDSHTWTFYKIATINGTVVLRWLGESNGYYSESVDIVKLEGDDLRNYFGEQEEKEPEDEGAILYFNGVKVGKVQPISSSYESSNLLH